MGTCRQTAMWESRVETLPVMHRDRGLSCAEMVAKLHRGTHRHDRNSRYQRYGIPQVSWSSVVVLLSGIGTRCSRLYISITVIHQRTRSLLPRRWQQICEAHCEAQSHRVCMGHWLHNVKGPCTDRTTHCPTFQRCQDHSHPTTEQTESKSTRIQDCTERSPIRMTRSVERFVIQLVAFLQSTRVYLIPSTVCAMIGKKHSKFQVYQQALGTQNDSKSIYNMVR